MRVLVAGANGATGSQVVKLLKGSNHEPVAMVRRDEQQAKFVSDGVATRMADLERREDFSEMVADVDAVVFAAGSGSKTGKDKTIAVDELGAVRLIDAAEAAGVKRFVMLSSINADPWSEGHPISHYYRAKGIADLHLENSDLQHTIVKPGKLTDEPAKGTIEAAPTLNRPGEIPRADVAAVLVGTLEMDNTIGKSFEILSGATPIPEALASL
ncbi:MAG: SDR family oxidoreductase [Phycisphaeraceae bacterium]